MPMHLSGALYLFRIRNKAPQSMVDSIPTPASNPSLPAPELKRRNTKINGASPTKTSKAATAGPSNSPRRSRWSAAKALGSAAAPVTTSLDDIIHGGGGDDEDQDDDTPLCSRCVSPLSATHDTDQSPCSPLSAKNNDIEDKDKEDDDPSTMSAGARLYHECKAIRRADVFPLKVSAFEDEDDDGPVVSRIPVPTSTPVPTEDGRKTLKRLKRSRVPVPRR